MDGVGRENEADKDAVGFGAGRVAGGAHAGGLCWVVGDVGFAV